MKQRLRFLDRGERFGVARLVTCVAGPIDQYACIVDLRARETATVTCDDGLCRRDVDTVTE